MKRLSTIEDTVRRAGRVVNPVMHEPPAFDPELLPHAALPISPSLLQALDMAVNEAVAAGLTVCDGVERMVQVLADFGVFLSSDDVVALTTADSGIFSR